MKFMFDTLSSYLESAMEIMNYVSLVLTVVLLLGFSWFYVYYIFNAFTKEKPVKEEAPKNKFAVLLAARNESKVINNILSSLDAQDYPKELFDVYVIVEDKEDPTVKIVENYGSNFYIVVRENIENRRTKGFALDDAYQYIRKNNLEYDAFMIFDADNVVSKNYLSVMNSIRCQGYQIGLGYRNFTNAKANWVSLTSGILFSFINASSSRGKSKLFNKTNLTGTGYYVDKKIVDDAGSWIWNGMTEDVELTYYAYKNHIRMKYYTKVEYFDEQPTDVKTMRNQHIRWVWGYFTNMKKKFKKYKFDYDPNGSKFKRFLYKVENAITIYPFVIFIVMEIIIFVVDYIIGFVAIGFGLDFYVIQNAFVFGSYHLFVVYIVSALIAFFTILVDNKNLKLKFGHCLKGIFTYPFFLADFFFSFIEGLFNKKKRTNWKVIEHKGHVSNDKAKL